MKIYLAHSVHERPMGKKVQAKIESLGYEVYNPFYPPNQEREDISDLDSPDIMAGTEKGAWNMVDVDKSLEIVDKDLEAVRKSDAVICIFPKGRTVGISCEMFFASYNLRMPVFTVCPEDMVGHPWIITLSDSVYTEMEDLYILLEVLSGARDLEELLEAEDVAPIIK